MHCNRMPSVQPPAAGGVSLQTVDGATAIELSEGLVTIQADRIRLEYQGGSQEWPQP